MSYCIFCVIRWNFRYLHKWNIDHIASFTKEYFKWTHWGRVTHICVKIYVTIALDNGLSPNRRQAIIETNADLLSIGYPGTNFSEIWINGITLSLTKMRLKMSSAGSRPSCLGLNELMFIDCKGIVDYVCDCCVYINAMISLFHICLTHWGRVTHICVKILATIGLDTGLSPNRRQASM